MCEWSRRSHATSPLPFTDRCRSCAYQVDFLSLSLSLSSGLRFREPWWRRRPLAAVSSGEGNLPWRSMIGGTVRGGSSRLGRGELSARGLRECGRREPLVAAATVKIFPRPGPGKPRINYRWVLQSCTSLGFREPALSNHHLVLHVPCCVRFRSVVL